MVLKFHQHQIVIFLFICNGILFSFLFKEKPIHFHDIVTWILLIVHIVSNIHTHNLVCVHVHMYTDVTHVFLLMEAGHLAIGKTSRTGMILGTTRENCIRQRVITGVIYCNEEYNFYQCSLSQSGNAIVNHITN